MLFNLVQRLALPMLVALATLTPIRSDALVQLPALPGSSSDLSFLVEEVPEHVTVLVETPEGLCWVICRNDPINNVDPLGLAPEGMHRAGIWLDKRLGLDEWAARDEAEYVAEHLTPRVWYISAAREPVSVPMAVLSNPLDRTPGVNDRRVAAHDVALDLLYGLSGAGLADQLRVATGDEPVLQQSAGQLARESFGYWNAGVNENSAAYQNTYLGLMGATFIAQVVLEKGGPTSRGGVYPIRTQTGIRWRSAKSGRFVAVPRNGRVVLGNYRTYETEALAQGATFLKVPKSVWGKLSPTERWEMNELFLDEILKNGNNITLMDWERKYSTYARELWYLRRKGVDVSGVKKTWEP